MILHVCPCVAPEHQACRATASCWSTTVFLAAYYNEVLAVAVGHCSSVIIMTNKLCRPLYICNRFLRYVFSCIQAASSEGIECKLTIPPRTTGICTMEVVTIIFIIHYNFLHCLHQSHQYIELVYSASRKFEIY